jgi:hypothetical protein
MQKMKRKMNESEDEEKGRKIKESTKLQSGLWREV